MHRRVWGFKFEHLGLVSSRYESNQATQWEDYCSSTTVHLTATYHQAFYPIHLRNSKPNNGCEYAL